MASEHYLEARRLELDNVLRNILGSNKVYFQPPESVKISYPCIIYEKSGINFTKADDIVYNRKCQYRITVVDKDPDSKVVNDLSTSFTMITYVRHYAADGLNHDVFTIYF